MDQEERLTPQLLSQLITDSDGPCISIFMPTFKTSPDSLQNPIRFQNLIKKAKNQLQKSNFVNHKIKTSLDLAATKVVDEPFWMHQRSGLAIFISPSQQQFFRLPLDFPEIVEVNHHFVVKPLLPLLTTNGKFYVLTLSQKDVKLYQATRDSIDKVFLGNIPRSMEDTIFVEDLEKGRQFHTGAGSQNRSAGTNASTQGGAGEERVKLLIERFLRQVEKGITALLIDQSAPLILYGTEYLTSMYKKANKYKHLLPETIDGNPEDSSKQIIHQKAWKIVRPVFKQAEKEALEEYGNYQGNGKTASDLSDILPATVSGRTKTLFILRDHSIWGNYDPDSDTLTIVDKQQPGTDDLINQAAIRTLATGGQVYSLKDHEMIQGTPIAAVYRY